MVWEGPRKRTMKTMASTRKRNRLIEVQMSSLEIIETAQYRVRPPSPAQRRSVFWLDIILRFILGKVSLVGILRFVVNKHFQ